MADKLQEAFVHIALGKRAQGASWDEVLGSLRFAGATPMQCIKVLRSHAEMSLSEAKDFLNASAGWADQRERFEAIQEGLGAAFDDAAE